MIGAPRRRGPMPRWLVPHAIGVIAVIFAAAGCHGNDAARMRALDTPAARRLVGVWDITLRLDQPYGVRAAANPSVRGTIALIGDRHHPLSFSQIVTPLHYGAYDIDFSPFGFGPGEPGKVPLAVATVSMDSVRQTSYRDNHIRIVLDPGDARLAIILDGTLGADSATGTWAVDSRTASGGGGFVMLRRRTWQY